MNGRILFVSSGRIFSEQNDANLRADISQEDDVGIVWILFVLLVCIGLYWCVLVFIGSIGLIYFSLESVFYLLLVGTCLRIQKI